MTSAGEAPVSYLKKHYFDGGHIMSIWKKEFHLPKLPRIRIPWKKLIFGALAIWVVWGTVGNIWRRFSPERIDYFAKFEASYIAQLTPPEENGLRDVLTAIGPIGLEQTWLADTVSWEDIPKDENGGKFWFENQWVPICEEIGIADPYAKPTHYDYQSLDRWLVFHGITGDEPPMSEDEAKTIHETICKSVRFPDQGLPRVAWDPASNEYMRLVNTVWSDAEGKNGPAKAWLDHTSPTLDIFATGVRKPHYSSYYQRPAGCCTMLSILLPDVQFQREMARATMVRANYRIGTGDFDEAIDDIMSLYYLSRRHYQRAPFLVTRLVGNAVEGMASSAVRGLLREGPMTPTDAQLARLAVMLDGLPPMELMDHSLECEQFMTEEILQGIFFNDSAGNSDGSNLSVIKALCGGDGQLSLPEQLLFKASLVLKPDLNRAREIVREDCRTLREVMQNSANQNEDRWKKNRLEEMEQRWNSAMLREPGDWGRLLPLTVSVEYRTEFFANAVMNLAMPAVRNAKTSLNRQASMTSLVRVGVALERYRLAEGVYPPQLTALVEKGFIAELPIDPRSHLGAYYEPVPYTPPRRRDDPDSIPRNLWDDAALQPAPYLLIMFGSDEIPLVFRWRVNNVTELEPNESSWSEGVRF